MSSNRKILKTKRQLAPEPAKVKRTDSVFPLKFGTKTNQVKKENDSKKGIQIVPFGDFGCLRAMDAGRARSESDDG